MSCISPVHAFGIYITSSSITHPIFIISHLSLFAFSVTYLLLHYIFHILVTATPPYYRAMRGAAANFHWGLLATFVVVVVIRALIIWMASK